MKKAYHSPTSQAFDIRVEAMLATSFNINNGEAEQWSNKNSGGWDCSEWSNADEDME